MGLSYLIETQWFIFLFKVNKHNNQSKIQENNSKQLQHHTLNLKNKILLSPKLWTKKVKIKVLNFNLKFNQLKIMKTMV